MLIWIEGSSHKPDTNLPMSRGIIKVIAGSLGEVMQKSRFLTFRA